MGSGHDPHNGGPTLCRDEIKERDGAPRLLQGWSEEPRKHLQELVQKGPRTASRSETHFKEKRETSYAGCGRSENVAVARQLPYPE